jgi:hypothetical protein
MITLHYTGKPKRGIAARMGFMLHKLSFTIFNIR